MNARALSSARLVVGYYLATPVFAVADLGFGLPVRVADVLPTGPRAGYYVVVFLLGILCARVPAAVGWVGMAESSTNLLILLLSILLPIWSLTDAALGGAQPPHLLDAGGLVNALLAGSAMVLSFHRHQALAVRRRHREPPRGV